MECWRPSVADAGDEATSLRARLAEVDAAASRLRRTAIALARLPAPVAIPIRSRDDLGVENRLASGGGVAVDLPCWVQRDEVIRQTIYVSDIDHQVRSHLNEIENLKSCPFDRNAFSTVYKSGEER